MPVTSHLSPHKYTSIIHHGYLRLTNSLLQLPNISSHTSRASSQNDPAPTFQRWQAHRLYAQRASPSSRNIQKLRAFYYSLLHEKGTSTRRGGFQMRPTQRRLACGLRQKLRYRRRRYGRALLTTQLARCGAAQHITRQRRLTVDVQNHLDR
jgi:hypothetical protein